MRVAMSIALALGQCDAALLDRQQALVRHFGLPEAAPGLAPAALWPYMRRDKKATAGALRWVLPVGPGRVAIQSGVADDVVEQALIRVTRAV
jgi:3-dehydroquinate synthetase